VKLEIIDAADKHACQGHILYIVRSQFGDGDLRGRLPLETAVFF